MRIANPYTPFRSLPNPTGRVGTGMNFFFIFFVAISKLFITFAAKLITQLI
jgi:hypothetical protein